MERYLTVGAAQLGPIGRKEPRKQVVDRLIALKFDPRLLRALWERSNLPFPEGTTQ